MTNGLYVRVPLAAFEQIAELLSDIDFLQANITDKSTIKDKVAQGHALIEQTLGENAKHNLCGGKLNAYIARPS